MHELAIIRNVYSVIENKLAELYPHASKHVVKKVTLLVGAFSAAIPESLTFHFQAASYETMFSTAKLEIKTIPLVIICLDCSETNQLAETYFICPGCMSRNVEIKTGRELQIDSFEVDETLYSRSQCD